MRKIIYATLIVIFLALLFFLIFILKPRVDDGETEEWHLVLIVVPSEDKKDILGYGSLFTLRDHTTSFFYLKPENREFRDHSLEWNDQGFKINDMSFNFKEGNDLLFRWNENNIGSDRFIDTFSGFERLGMAAMRFNGFVYDSIVLDEKISADISKLQSWWSKETFIFLKNESLSLIALKYDSYIDGILKINEKEYFILDVVRFDDNINIIFNEGIINGQCKRYGMYKIIESSEEGPEEVPISCSLEILFDNSEQYFFDNVFGQMEII